MLLHCKQRVNRPHNRSARPRSTSFLLDSLATKDTKLANENYPIRQTAQHDRKLALAAIPACTLPAHPFPARIPSLGNVIIRRTTTYNTGVPRTPGALDPSMDEFSPNYLPLVNAITWGKTIRIVDAGQRCQTVGLRMGTYEQRRECYYYNTYHTDF